MAGYSVVGRLVAVEEQVGLAVADLVANFLVAVQLIPFVVPD